MDPSVDQTRPLSRSAIVAHFQQHESLWQGIQDATDGKLSRGDYGYNVRVFGNAEARNEIFRILLGPRWGTSLLVEENITGDPAYVAFSEEATNLARAAVEADNILLCTADHVSDMRDNWNHHCKLVLCIQVSYAFFLPSCMIARQICSKIFK